MPFVKLPTGEVIDVPDNASPKDLAELELHMSGKSPTSGPAAQPATQGSGMGAQLMRQLGLTARAGLTGLTGTVGMVGDALNTGINMATGSKLQMPSQMIDRGMDAVGLPKPENTAEQVSQVIASLMAGSRDPLMGAITSKFKAPPAQLSERGQTVKAAQAAGLKVPPVEAEAGLSGRVLEAVAGRGPTEDIARWRNTKVTDALAKRAVGLPDDVPLTRDVINNAIQDTYRSGYEPIKQLGEIPAMPVYAKALRDTLGKYTNKSFPDADNAVVRDVVRAHIVPKFDAADAVSKIASLREEASAHFRGNEPQLGKAKKAIAKALEDNIESYLTVRDADLAKKGIIEGTLKGNKLSTGPSGQELLSNFRSARELMAKQYLVRDRVIEGTGSVDALKIAAKMQKNPGLLTGELAEIGRFASAMPPKIAGYTKQPPPIFTALEGATLAGAGGAAVMGNPSAAIAAGVPVGRAGLRQFLMSDLGQRMFAQPAPMGGGIDPRYLNAMPAAMGLFNDQ